MIRTSQKQLIQVLKKLKLPKNHVYIVHSSMLKFGLFEEGLPGMMNCLNEVLGPNATILMPAFTFTFGIKRIWDYSNSKAETGALAEYFRKLSGTLRTIHPFHSLSVCGPRALDFAKCTSSSSFGSGSPFELLYDMDAINLAIGISLVGGATFLHHSEEVAQVPYRYYKEFEGQILDANGDKIDRVFKMYVREITDTYSYVNVWDHVLDDFFKDGLVDMESVNGATLLAFKIRPSHDRYLERIKNNPFYCATKKEVLLKEGKDE